MTIDINAIITAMIYAEYGEKRSLIIDVKALEFVTEVFIKFLTDDFNIKDITLNNNISTSNFVIQEEVIYPNETSHKSFEDMYRFYLSQSIVDGTYNYVFDSNIIRILLKNYKYINKGSVEGNEEKRLIFNYKGC